MLSYWFYFDWVHTGGIDGGPLGFLTWTIPTIVGTLACDAVTTPDGRARVAKMFVWSAVLMGLGYLLSCGTTLYDVPEDQVDELAEQETARRRRACPAAERLAAQVARLGRAAVRAAARPRTTAKKTTG